MQAVFAAATLTAVCSSLSTVASKPMLAVAGSRQAVGIDKVVSGLGADGVGAVAQMWTNI